MHQVIHDEEAAGAQVKASICTQAAQRKADLAVMPFSTVSRRVCTDSDGPQHLEYGAEDHSLSILDGPGRDACRPALAVFVSHGPNRHNGAHVFRSEREKSIGKRCTLLTAWCYLNWVLLFCKGVVLFE